MKVYVATVSPDRKKGKLVGFLSHAFPLLPNHIVRNAFDKKDVKVNGVRSLPETMVSPGDFVQLFTNYEVTLPVVYEDQDILLINKPVGISVQGDETYGMNVMSIVEEMKKDECSPLLCHRLDNQTSGLLLIAKHETAYECLTTAFKNRTIEKRYVCVVKGTLRPDNAIKSAYLVKDATKAKVRIVTHNTPESKPIRTGYQVISSNGETSLVKVDLLTGRTHQIRAHMAYLAHPILGDDVYGDRAFNRRMKANRLMLCSVEMTIYCEEPLSHLNGKTFSVDAPF